jgi:hypothetical protein
VIAQLQRAGSDLTKPHEIEFFLYFPTEVVARQAANQFSARGYKAVVRLGAEQKDWLCQLTRHMVPTVAALTAARDEFAAFAKASGGQYDGWGAEVVPR